MDSRHRKDGYSTGWREGSRRTETTSRSFNDHGRHRDRVEDRRRHDSPPRDSHRSVVSRDRLPRHQEDSRRGRDRDRSRESASRRRDAGRNEETRRHAEPRSDDRVRRSEQKERPKSTERDKIAAARIQEPERRRINHRMDRHRNLDHNYRREREHRKSPEPHRRHRDEKDSIQSRSREKRRRDENEKPKESEPKGKVTKVENEVAEEKEIVELEEIDCCEGDLSESKEVGGDDGEVVEEVDEVVGDDDDEQEEKDQKMETEDGGGDKNGNEEEKTSETHSTATNDLIDELDYDEDDSIFEFEDDNEAETAEAIKALEADEEQTKNNGKGDENAAVGGGGDEADGGEKKDRILPPSGSSRNLGRSSGSSGRTRTSGHLDRHRRDRENDSSRSRIARISPPGSTTDTKEIPSLLSMRIERPREKVIDNSSSPSTSSPYSSSCCWEGSSDSGVGRSNESSCRSSRNGFVGYASGSSSQNNQNSHQSSHPYQKSSLSSAAAAAGIPSLMSLATVPPSFSSRISMDRRMLNHQEEEMRIKLENIQKIMDDLEKQRREAHRALGDSSRHRDRPVVRRDDRERERDRDRVRDKDRERENRSRLRMAEFMEKKKRERDDRRRSPPPRRHRTPPPRDRAIRSYRHGL